MFLRETESECSGCTGHQTLEQALTLQILLLRIGLVRTFLDEIFFAVLYLQSGLHTTFYANSFHIINCSFLASMPIYYISTKCFLILTFMRGASAGITMPPPRGYIMKMILMKIQTNSHQTKSESLPDVNLTEQNVKALP